MKQTYFHNIGVYLKGNSFEGLTGNWSYIIGDRIMLHKNEHFCNVKGQH